MSVLYLVGFIQSIFFAILITTKRHKVLSDLILLIYILILGGNLIVTYAVATGYYNAHPQIAIFDILYWVLLGPLLYLYIDLITTSRKRLVIKDLFLLIPAFIVFIGFSGFYVQSEVKDFFQYHPDSVIYKIAQLVWYYNSPIFYIIVIFKLRTFRKTVVNYYSNTKFVSLGWLYYLAHGFAFFLFFLIGSGLVKTIFHIKLPFTAFSYTWLVLVIYIFGIGFYGYKQRGIFSELHDTSTDEQRSDLQLNQASLAMIQTSNYTKTGLSREESSLLYQKLVDYMKSKKPYLDSELNLTRLAKEVGTTPHKLSQAINENSKSNFFDFINSFRVEEVKQYLSNPNFSNQKIIALAYDCGFNSKSSFYSIFKRFTSLTPIQFKHKGNSDMVA